RAVAPPPRNTARPGTTCSAPILRASSRWRMRCSIKASCEASGCGRDRRAAAVAPRLFTAMCRKSILTMPIPPSVPPPSARPNPAVSTGLAGIDRVLHGIEPGDNIVWEVDTIEEYQELVTPYAAAALAAGRHLI